jgi:5-hydroxyisourate hydrolase-like protein (transthyretin family)
METDMPALFKVSLLSCHVLNDNSGKPQNSVQPSNTNKIQNGYLQYAGL